ncbi:FAD/NAD(P)-dependent oxidoreductase [Micromonospora sagamiensis]|uniref:Hydrogen cyanide synthase HcnB n=1 Tax=Micromonospora sagamiensis TaxID=47875 RepID=A0A562WQD8_9ACTN|nr:NAD(P)/FAD-dependent oxidoreductase [Micromonospora sagamiensis]TWJ32366.1 hydrogen cyanide synthase HcnB [Micromonospora sagamiensis]BCL14568.1 hydrogen cyanide synthase subunit HcnB [Micromonospora sagamiensis]
MSAPTGASEVWPLVVVGGGPAGIAAATEAARTGLRCLLIDEAPRIGGQIYRDLPREFTVHDRRRLGRDHRRGDRLRAGLAEVGDLVEVRSGTTVLDIVDGRRLVCSSAETGPTEVIAERLVLATGAYDRPVPFPGWTLPGVITAGGTQALLKAMRVRPGERALVAGTGPLLLVVAGQLHRAGVRVVALLEAGRSAFTAGTLVRARRQWGMLTDGARYRFDLLRAGIPIRYNHTVFQAHGDGMLDSVTYGPVAPADWRPIREQASRVEVDLLVSGFGFVPGTELCELVGCRMVHLDRVGGWVPVRDTTMQTSVPGVFAVGDGAGVAGVLVAVEEGRIAGITAAEQAGRLTETEARRRRRPAERRLRSLTPVREALDEISYIRPGLSELATDATLLCRCEEVTRAEVRDAIDEGARNLQAVKLRTRLGMGACQGRNCAPSTTGLLCGATGCTPVDAGRINPRPPVKPVTLGTLAGQQGGRR